jgi:hypothetical protein
VVLYVNVLAAIMMRWILSKGNCALIVAMDRNGVLLLLAGKGAQ